MSRYSPADNTIFPVEDMSLFFDKLELILSVMLVLYAVLPTNCVMVLGLDM